MSNKLVFQILSPQVIAIILQIAVNFHGFILRIIREVRFDYRVDKHLILPDIYQFPEKLSKHYAETLDLIL